MRDEITPGRLYSRRDFGRLALAGVPAASLFARGGAAFALQPKPNSVWGGVPFGIFAPYRFGPEASDLEGVLKALVKFGVSQTELSTAVVERYVGAPQPAAPAGGAGRSGRGTPLGVAEPQPAAEPPRRRPLGPSPAWAACPLRLRRAAPGVAEAAADERKRPNSRRRLALRPTRWQSGARRCP